MRQFLYGVIGLQPNAYALLRSALLREFLFLDFVFHGRVRLDMINRCSFARWRAIENRGARPVCYRLQMKIALAQFNPTVGDFEGNRARILELARDAKSGGAEMAVFSELCLCGYPPQDLIERPAFAERNQIELDRLARDISLPSLVGFVGKAQDDTGKPVANSAALVGCGKILFEQRKMLLPTYDVFDETRYFQPAHTQYAFRFNTETLGITICEDSWNDKSFWPERLYDRDPVSELVGKGKHAHLEHLVLALSAGDTRAAARYASRHRRRAARSCRVRQPGGRQRQPHF